MEQRTSTTWPNDGAVGAYPHAAISFATYLLENTTEMVAAVDQNLRVVGLNAAFLREFELVFGKPLLLGERLDEALSHLTGDRDKATALCQRALAGESFRITEEFGDEQFLRKTYELAFSPILDTYGKTLLAGIVVRDVTHARINERRFDALLEAAPDAMIIMRHDGTIQLANAQAERMFRYHRPLQGMPVEILMPERFRRMHVAHRQHFSEHPATRPMGTAHADLWGLRADGSEFPVEISLNPLRGDGEQLVVAAIRDMTLRQSAEDRLRQFSIELEQRVAERTTALEQLNRELSERIRAQQSAEAALHHEQARLKAVLDSLSEGVVVFTMKAAVLDMNPAALRMHGYASVEEARKKLPSFAEHFEVRPLNGAPLPLGEWPLARISRGETLADVELEVRCKRSGRTWIGSYSGAPVRITAGQPEIGVFTVRDVTGYKRTEDALRASEAQFRLAFDNIPDVVTIYDRDLRIRYVNPAVKHITGLEPAELIGRFESEIWPKEVTALWHPTVASAFATASVQKMEIEFPGASGARYLRITCVPLVAGNGEVQEVMGITHDDTERKHADERLRQASLHDPLTGLPNRALLFEYAGHVFARNERHHRNAAILFLDLDRFKLINDTHGHEAGDAVLQEAARRILKTVRAGDYAFRLGGDEFLVLLTESDDGSSAAEVARHLCDALSRPYHVGALVLSSSPSIGISIYPRDGKDIDTLINHADAAMYQAKQLGRNNFQFFSHELAERAKALVDIEAQLRTAISNGEFHLHYQPVINMQTLEVVCAEALLRWPDAKTGPETFVPIAESTGMIARLGDWVIREACRQHNHWIENGLPAIPISVNVSAVQFRDKKFAERFEQALQECKVDATALHLEITETTVMENLEYTIGVLMRLRNQGIKILLDDFGTGYSSLSYLSRLPVDKIKVDKSFTHQLEHDMTSRAVTEAIIALGRTMNKEIIAEGIESREVLEYLRMHGCHHAQGFHVSRPVDGDTFESWYWAHKTPMEPQGGLPPPALH